MHKHKATNKAKQNTLYEKMFKGFNIFQDPYA